MLTRWLRRLVLDVQFGRIRLLPLVLLASYLLLGWVFDAEADWRVLPLVGVALLVFGGAWPLPVALAEATLFAFVSPLSSPSTAPSTCSCGKAAVSSFPCCLVHGCGWCCCGTRIGT